MKELTIVEGIFVAVVLVTISAVLWALMATVLPFAEVFPVLFAGAALLYCFYLLRRLPHRPGKLVLGLVLCPIVGFSLFFLSLVGLLLVLAGSVWVLRSWCRYRSALSGLADLALIACGLGTAVWAAIVTGSVFVSIWCFFLVQALFCLIPARVASSKSVNQVSSETVPENRFEIAYLAAERALCQLV